MEPIDDYVIIKKSLLEDEIFMSKHWQHAREDKYYNETMDISKTLDEIIEEYFNQPTNNENQTPRTAVDFSEEKEEARR